jgi:hypothetical protein
MFCMLHSYMYKKHLFCNKSYVTQPLGGRVGRPEALTCMNRLATQLLAWAAGGLPYHRRWGWAGGGIRLVLLWSGRGGAKEGRQSELTKPANLGFQVHVHVPGTRYIVPST